MSWFSKKEAPSSKRATNVVEALLAHGAVTTDDVNYVLGSHRWQHTPDGWRRFDGKRSGEKNTRVAYRLLVAKDGISMEDPASTHLWDWYWPDEELLKIYS